MLRDSLAEADAAGAAGSEFHQSLMCAINPDVDTVTLWRVQGLG